MGQVSNAVEKRQQGIAGLVEEYKSDYASVLPSHVKPETWIRLAQGALRRNKQLAEVAQKNPNSLLAALMEAARQGLEPGTEQFYLIPFGNEVQGIRGYQGEIELMYRAGAISSVIVEVVRERDRFEYAPGRHDRPIHDIDWDLTDRGKLKLVYAYAVMKDGATSKVVVLNKAHIDDAKRSAKGAGRADSPWKLHEEAMWLKTAAHRLQKWVPTSAEYRREVMRAAGEANRPAGTAPVGQHRAPDAPPYVDGEVIHDEVDQGDGWDSDVPVAQPGAGLPDSEPA